MTTLSSKKPEDFGIARAIQDGMVVRQQTLPGCFLRLQVVLLALSVLAPPVESQQVGAPATPELDAGFHLLYELKFEEARASLSAWSASHPEDALGSDTLAASYLFEGFYRQGVLTSEFFLNDKRFLGKIPIKPDQQLRDAFFAAAVRAQNLARLRLETNPEDASALFAMTLSLGMQADYASLIDRHQLESLSLIREADKFANRLLAVNPDAADAYLTLGAANYIIGSLPSLQRFLLHLGGVNGNKLLGIQQLEIAATKGRYLRPFAKIMLAMAALREKNVALARTQLTELVAEFPQNPLFVSELAKINGPDRSGPRG